MITSLLKIADQRRLSPAERLLWVALTEYGRAHGQRRDGSIFFDATWDQINAMTGLHRRTMLRCLDVLESRHLVEVERRGGTPNVYRLMDVA